MFLPIRLLEDVDDSFLGYISAAMCLQPLDACGLLQLIPFCQSEEKQPDDLSVSPCITPSNRRPPRESIKESIDESPSFLILHHEVYRFFNEDGNLTKIESSHDSGAGLFFHPESDVAVVIGRRVAVD